MVVVNDISSKAAKLAEFNVKLNNLTEKVGVANEDANLLLSRYAAPRRRFDYVDLDPFGSPVPYLDSALRALRNGGFLGLTATDMAPLCGVHPKACLRKYGGRPLRTEYCHELAVRLLIGCLASLAAKHDVGVCPVFSYSTYNHVRAYATVSYGAKQADKSIQNMGYILHCFSCFHRESQKGVTPPLKQDCPECGSKLQTAGPLWLGPLWDDTLCIKIKDEVRGRNLRNEAKIRQMISLVIEEAKAPLTYYVVDKICDKFNLPMPSQSKIVAELRKSGFQVVATHFNSKAVRTDAPASVLREITTRLTRVSSSKTQETNIREHIDDYVNEASST
jgi:tRNA (guanine26-N2/guanine27-N2)-dimethyltransferase